MKKSILILTITLLGLYTQARQQPEFVTLTAIACPDSGGVVQGGGAYEPGSVATLTAIAAEGYVFTYWTINGMISSMEPSITAVITSDVTMEAHFAQIPNSFTVSSTIYPEEAGSTTGTGIYNTGDTAHLVAHTNPNYTFENWSVNGIITGTDTVYSFAVTGNVNVVANWYFTPEYFTITTESFPADGGTTSGDGSVLWGAGITLTATANDGYTFTGWTENGELVSSARSYSFTVDAPRHLGANFALSTAVEDMETINPLAGMATVGTGLFSFTTNEDYELSVFNTLGQLVTTRQLPKGQQRVELTQKGMYIFSLTHKQNGQAYTQRVVVQ
ncbi:MAG TPA: InlB B-repeat-containing protein [Chitinophagales bacterium]|nr:InlB B-repeat-containing protein [Chitinophagales bacterium]